VFSYSTAHRKLYSNTIETGNTTPEGPESIAVYRTVEIDDALALDCSFSWEQKVYNNQKIILTLEVLNILDAKNKIGESSRSYYKDDYNYDIYQMGRQFWAGIAYEF
jgi:outer membrane receptor protein involved in Fe transport